MRMLTGLSTSLRALVIVGLGLAVYASVTRAQDSQAQGNLASAKHTAEAELGGYLGIAAGGVCRRSASDVVGCESWSGSVGPLLGFRWRFADMMSAGVFSTFSWGASSGYDTLQWQLAAQARWLPLISAGSTLWVGPDAGFVYAVDHVAADEFGARRTYSTAAPIVGLGTGGSLPLTAWMEFGISFRFFAQFFGGNQSVFTRQPTRDTQPGGSLVLSVNFLK